MASNDSAFVGYLTLDQLRDGTAPREVIEMAFEECAAYFRRLRDPEMIMIEGWFEEDFDLALDGDEEAAARLPRDLVVRALWVLAHERVVERRAVEARELEIALVRAAVCEDSAGATEFALELMKLADRAAREAVGAVDFIRRSDAEHPEEACMLFHKLCGLSVPCQFAFA